MCVQSDFMVQLLRVMILALPELYAVTCMRVGVCSIWNVHGVRYCSSVIRKLPTISNRA